MNATTPPGDGDDVGRGPVNEPSGDPAAHRNAYADVYQHAGDAPDLDAGAPRLRSTDLRRMNRRALGFLAATLILLLVLAFLLLRATGGSSTPKPRQETVQVPSLPQQPQLLQAAAQAPVPPAQPALPAVPPTPPLALVPSQPPLPPAPRTTAAERHAPTLVQRREMADEAGATGNASSGQVAASRKAGSAATSARLLVDPDTLMLRGTYIRCVLETRIISDIPGFTSCVVTEPVYSFDGKYLLLPKGSKVFGEYNTGPVGSRIAVVWDRVVTPTGIDVDMSSPGVDNLGGAGLPGHLDSHWPSRIGSALLISLMSDAFLYEGEKHGPRTDNISPGGGFVVQTPFQSNTARTLQSLASQAVQQSANRRATLTINQGSLIAIYVTRDVDFSGVVARN